MIRQFRRWGYSPEAIAGGAAAEAARTPAPERNPRGGSWISAEDWTRIFTLWSTDPEYVDDRGALRTLRLRGPAPSLEALIARVEPSLTVEKVCNRMLKVGAVTMVGKKQVAASKAHAAFVYAPGSKEQSAHHMSVLNALLWNFEHNSNPPAGASLWVEVRATHSEFPESALTNYSPDLAKRATAIVQQEDAVMERVASSMRGRGKTVRAHFHTFFSAPPHQTGLRTHRRSNRVSTLGGEVAGEDGTTKSSNRGPSKARTVRKVRR